MAKQRNALKAGLFILTCVVLAGLVVVGIKGARTFIDPVDVRYVSFTLKDDLGGLGVGDDVRIGGFKVGEVRDIELVQADDPRLAKTATTRPAKEEMLLLSISVPRKYKIRQGARVGVQTTVTGTSNLNIDNLGQGGMLGTDVVLAGNPSTFSELFNTFAELKPQVMGITTQLNEKTIPQITGTVADVRNTVVPGVAGVVADVRTTTVPKVNATVDEIKGTAAAGTKLVEQVRGHVDPTAAKVHKVGDNASAMMVEVKDVFGDTKTDFRGTVANLNAATGSVKEKLPGILEKVDSAMAKMNGVITQASEALVDVKRTVENTKDMTGSAKELIAGNKTKLDGMIGSLKTTGYNLERASAEIRRSPWRLLYQPKAGELSNLNLYDTAREFAEGANDLNDAAAALRDAVKDKDADEKTVKALMDRLDKSFTRFNEVERKLWDGVKD